MSRPSLMDRLAVRASFLLMGLCVPHAAHAQGCLDYSDYLHWFNSVETPGWTEAVALEGDLGFVANGSDDGDGGSISILDMETLQSPRILSTLPTPGFALDIDVEAGVVCVADGSDGLTIVEAADPENPSIIGRLPDIGFVRCVTQAGSIVLVGSDVLYAVDLSSPTSPAVLDHIEGAGISEIAIVGTRAYVSCDYHGLRVYDVSDPRDLRLLGSFDASCHETGLTVSLPYVYFVGKMYGFGVIDVSDPSAPIQVGWSPVPEHGVGVGVRNGRAYVAGEHGLAVMDIQDPATPAPLGRLPLSGSPHAVALAGSFSFVSSGFAGVQVVNIEHDWPAEPLAGLPPLGHTIDVAASGQFGYLAEGSAGIAVVDLVDPVHPVVVGTAVLPNSARMIAVEGTRVCVIDAQHLLHSFDVSEPSVPTHLWSMLLPEYPSELILSDGWAFIPCGPNGLVLIDISGSYRPAEMFIYPTPGWASDVDVQDHYAYVVDTDALLILDVTDPPKPQLVGQWEQRADEVSVDGDYACLSNGYGGLFLLDVHDPTNPVQIAECDFTSYTLTVTLSWPYLYSSNEEGGLVIHQTADPGGFSFTASCDLPRNAGSICREGDLLLVPLWDHGLGIYLPQCGDAAAAPAWTTPNVTVSLRVQNPFSAPGPMTLELAGPAEVKLSVFDASGRRVTTLADGRYPAGRAEIIWNGKDGRGRSVTPGIYFVSCRTTEGTSTAKLSLVR